MKHLSQIALSCNNYQWSYGICKDTFEGRPNRLGLYSSDVRLLTCQHQMHATQHTVKKFPAILPFCNLYLLYMFTYNELILQYILNVLLVNPTENVNGSASIFFHSAPNPASSLPRPHTQGPGQSVGLSLDRTFWHPILFFAGS